MNEDELLRRYGLRPAPPHLDDIRRLLEAQTELERQGQGHGDTEVMKLCCVQLFHAGGPADALAIWRAKSSSFDAFRSIDVQLMCGAGLAETKAYLRTERSEDASAALDHLVSAEAAGDFAGFTVEGRASTYADYYRA